jgi:hypothetical protein
LIGYGMSSVIDQGKPSKLRGGASFALLGLLNLLPDGKSARWYSITTERKRHPEWFREDLAHLVNLLREKTDLGAPTPTRGPARARTDRASPRYRQDCAALPGIARMFRVKHFEESLAHFD